MRKAMSTFFVMALLAGCASQRVAQTGPGQDFRGEVWTWDQQRGTVTLLQGSQVVRVRVTPDQMRGLRMHETATVHGVSEGPVPLEQVLIPGPSRFIGRGPAQDIDVTGTVASIDPRGVMTIDADGRRIPVWTARPGGSEFKVGDRVHARISVQPGTVVPASGETVSGVAPAASVRTEPGDYAVFVAPVTAADPDGAITLDSPRGPIVLPMPSGAGQWAGRFAEVRSEAHPAQ
jgi:hypothetical protein